MEVELEYGHYHILWYHGFYRKQTSQAAFESVPGEVELPVHDWQFNHCTPGSLGGIGVGGTGTGSEIGNHTPFISWKHIVLPAINPDLSLNPIS